MAAEAADDPLLPPVVPSTKRKGLGRAGSTPGLSNLRRMDVTRIYLALLFMLSCGLLSSVFVGHYLALIRMNSTMELKTINARSADGVTHPPGTLSRLDDIELAVRQYIVTPQYEQTHPINHWAPEGGGGVPVGKPGVSIVAACRNRHDTFKRSFPTFLAAAGVDELIIVDWSSDPSLHGIVDQFEDHRVKYIQVEGEENWVLSRAYNLGISHASYETIMRLDCDHAISDSFAEVHNLFKNESERIFYSGDYGVARNENEIHLNGAMVVRRTDFWAVFGYDERIQTYGWDDEDMYNRLKASGLTRIALDYDKIIHLLHSESARGQKGVEFASVETDVNRGLLEKLDPWGPESGRSHASEYTESNFLGYTTARFTKVPKRVTEFFDQEDQLKAWDTALGQRLHDGYGVVWDLASRLPSEQKRKLLRNLMAKEAGGNEKPRVFIAHVMHGLGNRIRALGSSMSFAKRTDRVLVVIWEKDEHCSAEFNDLFQNDIVVTDLPLKWPFTENYQWDAAWKDYVGYNYMEAEGNGAVKGQRVENHAEMHMYFKGAYIIENELYSGWDWDNEMICELDPTPAIKEMINHHMNEGLPRRVGVHIRNMGLQEEVAAIDPTKEYGSKAAETMGYWRRKSGFMNFANKMQEMVKEEPDVSFYVASDTHALIVKLKEMFPGKIIAQERDCDGRDGGCLRYALVDIISLSKTRMLLGSNWSSFTEAIQRFAGSSQKYLIAGEHFARDDDVPK